MKSFLFVLHIFQVSSLNVELPVVAGFSVALNTTIAGFDIYFYTKVAGIEDCIERCSWEERCAAVALEEEEMRCLLKGGADVWEDELSFADASTSAFVAMGSPRPPVVPSACERNEFRHFVGQEINGVELLSFPTNESLAECAEDCFKHTGCNGFVYTDSADEGGDNVCQLKRSFASEMALSVAEGAISGVPCPNDSVTASCPLGVRDLPDTDLPGRDIFGFIIDGRDRCLAICLDTRVCTGFTFNESEGSCFLKDGNDPFESIARSGVSSGYVCSRNRVPELERED